MVCWPTEGTEMSTRSATAAVVAGWRRAARTAAEVRPSSGPPLSMQTAGSGGRWSPWARPSCWSAEPAGRAELQAKQSRSATRRAKRRAKKEARHAAHINHRISKEIVAVAQRTGRGIALEELSGIRDRVRPSRDQRATLSSWPFHQLEEHLRYKARRAGVPVIAVDARYTSQMCPRCGHTARHNRPTRDAFSCRRCGLAGPAPITSPGSTCATAHARRGFSSTDPYHNGLNTSSTGRCDP
ncbi:transposase [Streptomyces sp. NBC_01320]|uniref:transposase n=1 Tax=Streptomyces sp. NBC_01320 TaxID=2903824 RepID=UPI002E141772